MRIVYDQQMTDVSDWDDRLKSVKWITTSTQSSTTDT